MDEVGAPVSLTGRYALQGTSLRAGLELWARHAGHRLVVLDDASSPEGAVRATQALVERGCRIVLGPYGSDCARSVARARGGAVVWNHGGAADDVQRLPGVVSVPSPSSRYLVALGRAVAELRPAARVAVLTASGAFARFARAGLQRKAPALGLVLVRDPAEGDAVLLCGPLEWEAERLRELKPRRGLLLGAVSAGVLPGPGPSGFPDGTLAPVQWHPDLRGESELGPSSAPLGDYLAAQAYAAGLIADRCLELAPDDPLRAAKSLRTSTFFGPFELGRDGLQIGHRLSVVRRRAGRTELFLPEVC